MKQKLRKVKRRHVNWYDLLFSLEDLKLSAQYWLFKSKHLKMSDNRIAYYVLKKNYSTTFLKKYRCGEISQFDFPGCYFYEPNDLDEGDIGSATVAEMRRQNGDF